MGVQKLPAVEGRVETGAVQFGDDWPGVYIRGDYAMHTAQLLEWLLDHGRDMDDAITEAYLRDHVRFLRSCMVSGD